MKRELKFRAWDTETGKMIRADHKWLGVQLYLDGTSEAYLKDRGYGESETYKIPRELVLMQYTGLKDKNGKEIYEGDCLDGIYAKGRIEWCARCGSFMYIGNVNGCFGCTRDLCSIDVVEDAHKYEIIGNIHENPELLT